ncbi:MAG TPA: tetratricopeptide repeat protein [Casimicrobiaceae bacterium]|nr:tetratricopeptide repeat protein [Casimicrobiaceae bacterium]
MSDADYAKWVERANAHRAAGRTIDALICYRRALRSVQDGAEARFQLGTIAWQLGDTGDAIALWRQAAAGAPADGSPPVDVFALRALADSLAMLGRFDEASDAANAVLARRSQTKRMRRLVVLLDAARGHDVDVAHDDDALRVALTGAREPWPLALVAAVASRLAAAKVPDDLRHLVHDAAYRAATTGPVLRGTEDALRVVALDLATSGADDRAREVAARYEAVCAGLAAGSAPAFWPRRATAGPLRVGVLRSAQVAAADRIVVALRSAFELESAPTAARATVPSSGRAGIDLTIVDLGLLPPDADATARTLATADFDVLVDAGGLAHASGPVLALHPARRVWGYAESPALALSTLVHRSFTGAPDELIVALAEEAKGTEGAVRDPRRQQNPAELAARRDAAVIAHRDGDLDAARAGYDAILAEQPGDPQTLYLRAMLERDRGDAEQALVDLRAAVEAAPGYVDACASLVQAMTGRGGAATAATLARTTLGQGAFGKSKRSATLWRALGQAELARGDGIAAATAFSEALALVPDHADSHYNHGVALQRQRDLDGAVRAWQRAVALDPRLEAAHFNLGVAFDRQGMADAAVAAFMQALELAPGRVDAYKALGETLHAAGRIDDWVANFRRFEARRADHIAVAPMAIEVAAWTGDYALLDRTLDALRRDRYSARDASEFLDALQQLLFLLLYVDVEPELVVRYSRLHNDLARRFYGEPWPRASERRPGRLRIGYVSGDLRNHVMGKMMWEALHHHDHASFEVFGYATDRRRDAWTTRIMTAFDHFDDVSALGEVAAARRIAADDLDLLVDLSTHTKGARPGIFALKPARVQVTHVASAGTAALASIDFKLTDRFADVEGSFPDGLEAPLVMEGCVYPWRHLAATEAPASAVATSSVAAATTDDAGQAPVSLRSAGAARVVIGAFVTPLKLSQRCLALWREVLQRIPQAVLAFSPLDARTESAYRRLVIASGIDPARIVFVPRSGDDATDLARYREVDFVLDPMPYGGVNGTLEPLAMGVPVVTLVGRRHGERSSYSILANLGVTETVAQTGPEYVDIAVRLAGDPSFMQAVRERIRVGIAHSPLTDMEAHTRNLERAYVAALGERAPEALAGAGVASAPSPSSPSSPWSPTSPPGPSS